MNEDALRDSYDQFVSTGYEGKFEDYKNLLSTNNDALNDAHKLFSDSGYNGDVSSFSTLLGVKKKEETLPSVSDTPSAKPSRSLSKVTETTEEVEEKDPLAFETQTEEPSSLRVEQPTFIDEQSWEGADPLFMGGETLKSQEDERIAKKQQTLREDVFRKSMNIAGRRGIPIDKEDIPTSDEELNKLGDAAKNYEILITSKLSTHIPEDLQIKSALVSKEKQILDSIKSGDLTKEESNKERAKLLEIENQLILQNNNKKLFNPVTGETVDQDKAPIEAVEYSDKVQNLVNNEYSDLEDAYKASEKAIHLYDYYEEELDKVVDREGYPNLKEGTTYKDLLSLTNNGEGIVHKQETEKAALLKDRWLDSKANAEAISRAILLNEDPSQVDRGFGGGAGFWEGASKGFMESVGQADKVTDTEGDFATRFVDVIKDAGKDKILTKAQVANAEKTFTEKLGYGIGASIPVMAEIAITTAVTEGVATEAVIAKNIKRVKDIFGKTKAGKLMANVVEQGAKGYASFAPTSESGATGVGEGVAQGVMDSMLPENLIGGKYGKLLNYAIRTIGGGIGESIQEVSGQYIDALNENGYDAQAAFNQAFGRNAEERWENLALLGSTSLLFSGVFNGTRLFATKKALQDEIDNGNVPEKDIEAAQEIVDSMGDKISSNEENPPAITKEDQINQSEVSAVKEQTKPIEDAPTKKEEKEEVAPIKDVESVEATTEQAARGDGDTDTKQGEVKEEIDSETNAKTKKIKVFRGRGKNYSETENEGFDWVATDKSTADEYSSIDEEGNLTTEEREIDNPKNVFVIPYKNPNQHVTGENIANHFRGVMTQKIKNKKISKEEWMKIKEKINEYEKIAGDNLEMFHTKINKPNASKLAAEILSDLGYDAISIKEGGKTTYGLLKKAKAKADTKQGKPKVEKTTEEVKIFKGIGGKKDAKGERLTVHPNVKGTFAATDLELATEYEGGEGVAETTLPKGTTVETVEIDTKGLTPKQYREAETEAINNSDAQVVKLITVDGKIRKGKKKQEQYIIKDREISKTLKKPKTSAVKKESKGETLSFTQVRTVKGKKGRPDKKVSKTINYDNVDTKAVLHTDKNGNKLFRHDNGYVTVNKNGKVVSPETTKGLVQEYEQVFDYSIGEKAKEVEVSTTEEADRHIAETSKNPIELAEVIDRRRGQEATEKSQVDATKDGAIADQIGIRSVNPESFENMGMGDKTKSNIDASTKTNYLAPKGKGDGLDIIAKNASEAAGFEITDQDVLNFIAENPKGSIAFRREYRDDSIKKTAEDTFREVTGLEPTKEVIDLALNKETEVTKDSILKEIEKLPHGSSTHLIAKKAIKLGIVKDVDIQKALAPKIKAYKEFQKEMNKEFGLSDDSDLPFQKGSRKNIAGRAYLGNIIKALKKALPGVKIEFDESMEEFGTIRDGVIVINPKKATTDTAIHEYAHIWVKLLKSKNNILYKAGIALVKRNTELMEYIASTRPDLTNENDIAEEALVTAIGEDGSDFFQSKEQQSKLKNFLDNVAKAIRKFFGIKKSVNWREISEMSLKDFTRLASQELLNETPLATLTDADVQKIMSEDVILDTITIDSDILTGKILNRLGKTKEYFRGIFSSAGKLPKWFSDLNSNTKSAIEAIMSSSANDVKIFNKFLKEHIKENNLDTKQVETLLHDINDVFTGEKTVNAIGLDQNQDLALAIASMRNTIDLLSQELVDSGYIEGDIVATINDNIGTYITRSYEIHKVKPSLEAEWLSKLPKEVVAKAKKFIISEFELSKIIKIRYINNGDGTYKVTMINEFGMETPSVIMSRGDLISVLSEDIKGITDGNVEELNEGEGTITLNETVSPEKYGIKFKIKEEDINRQISDILGKHLSEENSFGAAGLNKKDISILKKRKDIPKEIRDLLGEIKDPVANYMETMSKMASYIEYSKFLTRMKKEGEGTLVWNEKDAPDKAVRISAEKNPKWKPLDGMFTTKEFKSALEHYERNGALDWTSDSAKYMYGMYMYLNTLTKTALTKWNIPSNFRNHYGAIMMAARAGYFNPIDFAKAYSDFWKGMKAEDVKNFDRAEFDMMRSYGIIDDGVGYQTYKDSLNRAMKTAPQLKKMADKFSETKAGKIINAPREFMDKAYLAPDAAAKIFLFRKMKVDYAKAYPELTEEQLNEKVANMIKDIMPTYSKMSKGAQSLSRNPLVGAFASFTTETVRNYGNQVSSIKEDMAQYEKTGNEHAFKLAKKKIRGLVVMTTAIPMMATALRLILGIDNEDEEAIRSTKAPWERNAWTLYLDKGKDGTVSSVDLSYTDPLSVLSKPLYALMNGVYSKDMGVVETADSVIQEIIDQFMGREPMFGALYESITNKDGFGRPISQPLDDEEWKRATHVLDIMKPKFIDTFKDVKKVWSEDNESEFGRKYEPLTYLIYTMGVRVKKNDVLRAVQFKIGNEVKSINDAKNIYKHSDTKSQKKLDKANIELAKLFKEHSLNIKAAVVLGASRNNIIKALNNTRENKTRYIPKYWVDQLLSKQFIPLTPESKKQRVIKPRKSIKSRKSNFEKAGQSTL